MTLQDQRVSLSKYICLIIRKMSYLNASVRTPFWGPKTPNEFKYIQNVFNAKFPDISITKACYRDLFKSNFIFNGFLVSI